MNTTSTPNTPPPASDLEKESPLHVVAIKTLVMVASTLYPDSNLIGTFLLYELCRRELAGLSLLPEGSGICAGPLNNAWVVFRVRQTGPALEALDRVLTAVGLRGPCTILYLDAREKFFRPHGPDNALVGPGFTIEQMTFQRQKDFAELQKDKEKNEALGDYIRELLKRNPPPPPDATPP